jgi:osmotically-inducible protein OsmY
MRVEVIPPAGTSGDIHTVRPHIADAYRTDTAAPTDLACAAELEDSPDVRGDGAISVSGEAFDERERGVGDVPPAMDLARLECLYRHKVGHFLRTMKDLNNIDRIGLAPAADVEHPGLVTQPPHRTDQELKTAVTEELQYIPSIDATAVEVQVSGGTVTLFGEVPSLPERLAVKHAAMQVGGVRNVTNKTTVRTHSDSDITDQDIAQAAGQVLAWAVDVPPNAVTADVQDHRITLSGHVAWEYQRNAAARAVLYLKGVTRVSNEISLESPPPSGGTKAAVQAAMQRSAELDARRIMIDLSGAELTLRGSVRSWSQRRAAERSAWSAAGVTSVRNELHIAS